MKNNPRKKAIALCIIFAAVFVLHGVSGPLSIIYQTVTNSAFDSASFLIRYYCITLAVASLVYLPLSIGINRLAKKAQMQALKIISLVAVIVLAVYLSINAIVIPLVLFMAG